MLKQKVKLRKSHIKKKLRRKFLNCLESMHMKLNSTFHILVKLEYGMYSFAWMKQSTYVQGPRNKGGTGARCSPPHVFENKKLYPFFIGFVPFLILIIVNNFTLCCNVKYTFVALNIQ